MGSVTAIFIEPGPTATALLLLGRGTDEQSERGVDCPGDLPAPSDPELVARAAAAQAALGDRVFILGHHYQRDEVIQFADVTGDSFKLARDAAARPDAEFIVFCGVHFMAESADILTGARAEGGAAGPGGRLLDGRHGGAVPGGDRLGPARRAGLAEATVPVTYMNSSADIKGFVGERGGVVCTSSNARAGAGPGRSSQAGGARCSSCPTSTWAATPRSGNSACRWPTACCGTRTSRAAASPTSSCAPRR